MDIKAGPDCYRIMSFESTSNIRRVLRNSICREPSPKIATKISACLRQGRMFFETAIQSPIEIRPLLIFHGVLGFSKAIILARHQRVHEASPISCGLSDTSCENVRIENIKLKIEENGIFQQANDVIAMLEGVNYNQSFNPLFLKIPFDSSMNIMGKEIKIRDILARIPSLGRYYKTSFKEYPKNKMIILRYMDDRDGLTHLEITDPEIYNDRVSLKRIVQKWRLKYPILEKWCLIKAFQAMGVSYLMFGNINKDDFDEFSEEFLVDRDGIFETKSGAYNLSDKRIDFRTILPPLTGGLTNRGEHMSLAQKLMLTPLPDQRTRFCLLPIAWLERLFCPRIRSR